MKNNIDSNFAIAILALVAACIGMAFVFNSYAAEEQVMPTVQIKSSTERGVLNTDEEITDTVEDNMLPVEVTEDYQEHFPPAPSQAERQEASLLPKEECECWVEIIRGEGACHPVADCI